MPKYIVLFFLNFCIKYAFSQTGLILNSDTDKLSNYQLSEKFKEAWFLDSNGCKNLRSKYVNSLLANKKLNGLQRSDFIEIFGKPSEEVDSNTLKYYVVSLCNEIDINSNIVMAFIVFNFKEGVLENQKFELITQSSPSMQK